MTDKTLTSSIIDKEKFAKFVNKYVYWWGGCRPDPDVDAALRFMLAKCPRFVENMAAVAGNIGLMKKLMKAGADLYATDNSGADPLYVLKIFKYGKYIKYSKELMKLDMKIKNDTLKHEDSRRKTATGYEFDI